MCAPNPLPVNSFGKSVSRRTEMVEAGTTFEQGGRRRETEFGSPATFFDWLPSHSLAERLENR